MISLLLHTSLSPRLISLLLRALLSPNAALLLLLSPDLAATARISLSRRLSRCASLCLALPLSSLSLACCNGPATLPSKKIGLKNESLEHCFLNLHFIIGIRCY
ncbi:hypothetical protein AAC387_Pa11g1268 [Persea americana]